MNETTVSIIRLSSGFCYVLAELHKIWSVFLSTSAVNVTKFTGN